MAKKRKKSFLKKFYALTLSSSVYFAEIGSAKGVPYLVKIAQKSKDATNISVGERIDNGTMIAVADRLHMFIPEGSGWFSPMSTFQREIWMVNSRWHGGQTSQIVALFKQKSKALKAINAKDLVRCDPRWEAETVAVLRAIGEDHPYCAISTSMPQYQLMPPEKWQIPVPAAV